MAQRGKSDMSLTITLVLPRRLESLSSIWMSALLLMDLWMRLRGWSDGVVMFGGGLAGVLSGMSWPS